MPRIATRDTIRTHSPKTPPVSITGSITKGRSGIELPQIEHGRLIFQQVVADADIANPSVCFALEGNRRVLRNSKAARFQHQAPIRSQLELAFVGSEANLARVRTRSDFEIVFEPLIRSMNNRVNAGINIARSDFSVMPRDAPRFPILLVGAAGIGGGSARLRCFPTGVRTSACKAHDCCRVR